MKFTIFLVSMLLLIGVASSIEIVNLSGVNSTIFDDPFMAKDGVGTTQLGAEIWGTPSGWNSVSDGTPFGARKPLSIGLIWHQR